MVIFILISTTFLIRVLVWFGVGFVHLDLCIMHPLRISFRALVRLNVHLLCMCECCVFMPSSILFTELFLWIKRQQSLHTHMAHTHSTATMTTATRIIIINNQQQKEVKRLFFHFDCNRVWFRFTDHLLIHTLTLIESNENVKEINKTNWIQVTTTELSC